ncbi:ER membrane DUF1077 domain-containing protein [Gaeumannomyces tritici R3-111a-1]|uniref:ER membrane protein complex subunit 4 n=1 Tax=Gaeumannomyces tritici (strain R3-111a-1) TaxID=644352 RepID=J3NP13_GAET3|nr:ER membrane DUF1077 domain-containing protein [Gaeumannomyces tritici R3-111a-1]EJT77916.1 ER membrane DUF1077 domain-containing protein [Gaeumannomyces tritici R3-111a-1]
MVSDTTPRWVAELQSPVPVRAKSGNIADPPGFPSQLQGSSKKRDANKDGRAQTKTAPTPEEMDTLKVKKAWEVALAPIKGLPMTAIMMYMSGNSLQIFTIMTVFMAFKNPVAGIIGTAQAFERFETETNKDKMLQVKIAYVLMQFAALGLAVWKVNAMGLLPTTRSDWLAWEVQREPLEYAVPAL